MKKVFIDSKNRIVVVNGKKIPGLLLGMIRGAIGKMFVVKHYKGRKIVITKFPDMCSIQPSQKQQVRRNLFREAVVYAKWIIADAERKKAFRKSLPRQKQKNLYQSAIQLYMRMQGNKQWLRKHLAIKAMATPKETAINQLKPTFADYIVKNLGATYSITNLHLPIAYCPLPIPPFIRINNCDSSFTLSG